VANIACGGLIDEAALVDALEYRGIFGAGFFASLDDATVLAGLASVPADTEGM
jgi:lactate dehydrogenase-like 2-hydroxyacid dehydrogenase